MYEKMKIQGLAVAAVILVAFSACGNTGKGPSSAPSKSAPASSVAGASPADNGTGPVAQNITVVTDPATIGAYSPPSVTVAPGEAVKWTFQDSNPHTVTSDGDGFNSDVKSKGMTFTYKFEKAGSFPYHCNIHPEMHGTVIVQ